MDGSSIRELALALDRAERATLAELLLASLVETDPAIDQAWLAEVRSRMAAHRSGEIEPLTADQFFRGEVRSPAPMIRGDAGHRGRAD